MLHSFYPILPDVNWLKRLVPLGIRTVQLRVKDAQADDLRLQIEESLELCRTHDCQLVVNDYWREAIALDADFIHLGQEDLASADLSAIRAAGLQLGVSTHDEAELVAALAAKPDYVALGPIYETKLKIMKWAPQGLERMRQLKASIPCPLVAIGGITVKRADAVYRAGADSIAVVTDIVTHNAPEERVRQWLALAPKTKCNPCS